MERWRGPGRARHGLRGRTGAPRTGRYNYAMVRMFCQSGGAARALSGAGGWPSVPVLGCTHAAPDPPVPALLLPPQDRLLLGKPLATALDTADPEAWTALDRRTRSATALRPGRPLGSCPWRAAATGAGLVDWAAAPRWDEEAEDVTWSRFPPSEPETAVVLCHHRWQAREAALGVHPRAPRPAAAGPRTLRRQPP